MNARSTLLSITLTLVVLAAGVPAAAGATPPSPTHAVNDASSTGGCTYPFSSTDATGTNVTLDAAPQRVVVVGASATQTVWDVGASGKVAGIWKSPYTTYLDNASAKPNVASQYGYADVEKVLKRNPDVVLLANVQKNATAEKLRQAGVTVYKFNASTSIDDIYAKTRLTGHLVGACGGANDTVNWMHQRLTTVKRVRERANATSSIYYPMGGGYTAGPNSFITNVMAQAGTKNVVTAPEFSGQTAKVSSEFVVKANPDWLLATYTPSPNGSTPAPKDALPKGAAIRNTTAYENGRVVLVNGNYLSQPAPRIVYGIENVTKTVHPDAWAAVHANASAGANTSDSGANTTTNESTTVNPAQPTTSGTTTASSPGFGLATALVALVGLLLLGRRR